jgi:hypothetical protein
MSRPHLAAVPAGAESGQPSPSRAASNADTACIASSRLQLRPSRSARAHASASTAWADREWALLLPGLQRRVDAVAQTLRRMGRMAAQRHLVAASQRRPRRHGTQQSGAEILGVDAGLQRGSLAQRRLRLPDPPRFAVHPGDVQQMLGLHARQAGRSAKRQRLLLQPQRRVGLAEPAGHAGLHHQRAPQRARLAERACDLQAGRRVLLRRLQVALEFANLGQQGVGLAALDQFLQRQQSQGLQQR